VRMGTPCHIIPLRGEISIDSVIRKQACVRPSPQSIIGIRKDIRAKINKQAGDTVSVTIIER